MGCTINPPDRGHHVSAPRAPGPCPLHEHYRPTYPPPRRAATRAAPTDDRPPLDTPAPPRRAAHPAAPTIPAKLPTRRSLRLRGFDYAQPGAYFVTVVVQNRWPLFGEVIGEEMRLNGAGRMIQRIWESLPSRFPPLDIDEFIVMPNHVHGIVVMDPAIRAEQVDSQSSAGAPREDVVTLSNVLSTFKSLTTVDYARGVKAKKWRPFRRRLWQRSYYDHVVRNEESLTLIREYIAGNPTMWSLDPEHPVSGHL